MNNRKSIERIIESKFSQCEDTELRKKYTSAYQVLCLLSCWQQLRVHWTMLELPQLSHIWNR